MRLQHRFAGLSCQSSQRKLQCTQRSLSCTRPFSQRLSTASGWIWLGFFLNGIKSKMLSTTQSSLCTRANQKELNTFLLVLLTPVLKRSISTHCFHYQGLCYSRDHLQVWSQCSLKVLEARLLIPWQASVFLDSVIGVVPWPLMACPSDSWQWFPDGWSPLTCPLTAAE